MPDWVIAVISIAGSALISGVVGYLVKRTLDKYFAKKDEEAEKLQKLKALEKEKEDVKLEEMIDRIVGKHIEPVKKDVDQINTKLTKVADGTLDTLRDRILSSYYKCLEKGYRTQYDIDNVEHMYRDYLNLEGNTFVAECVGKFKNIPTEKEYEILQKQLKDAKRKTRKPRAKKQVLLENN